MAEDPTAEEATRPHLQEAVEAEAEEQAANAKAATKEEEEEEPLTEEEKALLNNERSCIFETRVEHAAKCQEIGSNAFRAKELPKAIQWYKRALFHVEFDEGTWYFELLDKHRETVNKVRLPVYLNLAACFLSDEALDLARAIENSSEALKIDSNNTKALFRNGKAHLLRGNYDEAWPKLKQAAENAPNDRAIRECLKLLAEKTAQQKAKEKNVWGGKLKAKESTKPMDNSPSCDGKAGTETCCMLSSFKSWQMAVFILVMALLVAGMAHLYKGKA